MKTLTSAGSSSPAAAYETFGSTYDAARCRRALANVVQDPARADAERRVAEAAFARLGAAGVED
jgi:hypothetical protein